MSDDNTKVSDDTDGMTDDGMTDDHLDLLAETEAADADADADADDAGTVTADTDDAGTVTADTDTADTDTTPAKPRHRVRILAGVLGALLIASAGLTALLYFHSYRADQATGPAAAESVLVSAKEATIAVLSYSPDSLDKDLEAAKAQLTGDFLNYYTQFTDQVVRPAVKTKQVSTSANVVQAAVSEMHPDEAKVLMFVNQTTTSADRAEPSMTSSSVVVTMKKVDNRWLISAFDPV